MAAVSYRFFTRHGGASTGRFGSLNISYGTGDEPENIVRNRAVIKEAMGVERLVSAAQVHDRDIYVDDGEDAADLEVDGYDGLITDRPGTGLMIQQADCQAVLLYDEEHRAVGAVHSGWRGSVANIIEAVVARMEDCYGSRPSALRAWVSPSLGPCCAEFVNYRTELPASFCRFQAGANHFDFWRISEDQLIQVGLKAEAVHLPDTCTCCSEDYFSYRRAVRQSGGICGRQASVICLK